MDIASSVKDLLSGGSVLTVGTIATMLLGFVETAVLTRVLSTSDYGTYALAIGLIWTLAAIGQVGLGATARRYVADFRAQNDRGRAREVARITLAVGTAVALIVGGMTWVLRDILADVVFQAPLLAPLFAGFAVALVGKIILDISADIALGVQAAVRTVLAGETGQRILRLTVALCIFVGIVSVSDAGLVLGILLLLGAGAAVIGVVNTTVGLVGPVHPVNKRRLLRFALPLAASSVTGQVLSIVDITLLGLISGTEAVGLYRPAFAVASAVTVGYVGLNRLFSPIATEYISREEIGSLAGLVTVFRFWTFLVTGTIFVYTSTFASALLRLFFGPGYGTSAPVVYAIGGALTLSVGIGPVGSLLEATERSRTIAVSYLLALGVNIGLNTVLIPKFGAAGAAIGTGISLLLLNAIQASSLHQHLRGTLSLRRLLLPATVAASALFIIRTTVNSVLIIVVLSPIFFTLIIGVTIIGLERTDAEQQFLDLIS